MKRFLTLLLFSSLIIQLKAQENKSCINTLVNSNKEYEAGHFDQCVKMLKPCIGYLNKDEVFEAYRLLSLCYLNLNDSKAANEAAKNLLQIKPDYQDFPYFDPIEFTKLLAKYEIWPRLEFGIQTGLNVNSVHPLKNYSVTGSDAKYLPLTGYQAGISAEYFLKRNLSLNALFLYEGINYTRTASNVSGWDQNFKEKLNYFSLPLMARYYAYQWHGLLIAAEGGVQTQFLNTTHSNITLNNPATGESVQNTLEQSSQRNKTIFYATAGLILKYKMGGGYVTASLRYAYGLSNIVKSTNRYDNLDFILANQYVDSDIAFNPFYFNLGYQFPIPGLYAVKLK